MNVNSIRGHRRMRMLRFPLALAAFVLGTASLAQGARPAPPVLNAVVDKASAFANLNTLLIARDGEILVDRAFRGRGTDRPTNIKSASKTIISALVGIAIDRKMIEGVEAPVFKWLGRDFPPDPDPRLNTLTIGNLLSMQAGLERTSGVNYGRWISSPNWVRFALSRPFVDEPGGRMLYSTGSTHLLSAILTRAGKDSTLDLAREWLGEPLGITISPWTRDPQGIFLGGNEMALSPKALLRFGEMYRQGGIIDGKRVVSEAWVKASWEPRTMSPFTGDAYGYGWFVRRAGTHNVYYAWGYGGQLLYVVPSLNLTVVITSDPTEPSGRTGYVRELHALLADDIIPAVEARD
jgi:CubicO group peptidase (beta-lactamase class C family)